MVTGNRTLRKRLVIWAIPQTCLFSRISVTRCVLFLSTLKPVDFILKKSRFQISLEKYANTRS